MKSLNIFTKLVDREFINFIWHIEMLEDVKCINICKYSIICNLTACPRSPHQWKNQWLLLKNCINQSNSRIKSLYQSTTFSWFLITVRKIIETTSYQSIFPKWSSIEFSYALTIITDHASFIARGILEAMALWTYSSRCSTTLGVCDSYHS